MDRVLKKTYREHGVIARRMENNSQEVMMPFYKTLIAAFEELCAVLFVSWLEEDAQFWKVQDVYQNAARIRSQ